MSRITVILALLFAPAISMAAPSCEGQVWGYNIYERLVKGKIVEKYSIFEINEWSGHSSFEGLLVKNKTEANLEIDVRKEGNTLKTKAWSFANFELNNDYRATKDFDSEKFFEGLPQDSYFVIRLMKADKVVCETAPLEVFDQD